MSPAPISLPTAAATYEFAAPLSLPEDAQLAAQKVEGMFLSMLIKELRESSGGDGLFPGDSAGIHGGIFDMMLGDFLAENSPGLGIARYLQAAEGADTSGDGTSSEGADSSIPLDSSP
jgi:Rod binding domain-containing protein